MMCCLNHKIAGSDIRYENRWCSAMLGCDHTICYCCGKKSRLCPSCEQRRNVIPITMKQEEECVHLHGTYSFNYYERKIKSEHSHVEWSSSKDTKFRPRSELWRRSVFNEHTHQTTTTMNGRLKVSTHTLSGLLLRIRSFVPGVNCDDDL
jgi:hypothetical protein